MDGRRFQDGGSPGEPERPAISGRAGYAAFVKSLHTARHAAEAHLIRGYLESQGIAARVRGEYLTGGIGELPVDMCRVWVVEDREFTRADELLQQYLRGDDARLLAHQGWRCGGCREEIEGQFTDCWNCGAARPET